MINKSFLKQICKLSIYSKLLFYHYMDIRPRERRNLIISQYLNLNFEFQSILFKPCYIIVTIIVIIIINLL